MPTNKLHFTIHQTFDLNTSVDKITVLGIRTPSPQVVSRYVNMQNWKKIKFNYCNFKLACVSQLPVDPLGVGFEAGQIAPQELVNPMLFKTVTGDTISSILDIIYTNTFDNQDATLTEQKIEGIDSTGTITDPMNAYYTLLGDDSFRQAHPQVGLEAKGLVPLVREMLSTRSLMSLLNGLVNPYGINDNVNDLELASSATRFYNRNGNMTVGDGPSVESINYFISGSTRPMPAFDITGTAVGHGSDSVNNGKWPVQHVAVCVMPPAIQKSLYYRCIVSWNITLSEFFPSYLGSNLLGSTPTHIYNNWMEVPVDTANATALNLLEDETGIITTGGVDNIRKVTENVS